MATITERLSNSYSQLIATVPNTQLSKNIEWIHELAGKDDYRLHNIRATFNTFRAIPLAAIEVAGFAGKLVTDLASTIISLLGNPNRDAQLDNAVLNDLRNLIGHTVLAVHLTFCAIFSLIVTRAFNFLPDTQAVLLENTLVQKRTELQGIEARQAAIDIPALEARQAALAAELTALDLQKAAIDIPALEARQAALAAEIADLETQKAAFDIPTLEARQATLTGEIAALGVQKADLTGSIAALDVQKAAIDIPALEARQATLTGEIAALGVQKAAFDIPALEARQATLTAEIAALDAQKTAFNIPALEARQAALTAEIADLETQRDDKQGQVDAIDIDAATTALSELRETLETEMADLQKVRDESKALIEKNQRLRANGKSMEEAIAKMKAESPKAAASIEATPSNGAAASAAHNSDSE